MAFCDLFKEFIPIRVDEDIYLRQHEPEKDARPFRSEERRVGKECRL